MRPDPVTDASTATAVADRRRHPRHDLILGYTAVYIKTDRIEQVLAGHAYDVSAGGMAFELDIPLLAGEELAIVIVVPQPNTGDSVWVGATGRVVRMLSEPGAAPGAETGPVRMAVEFDRPVEWPADLAVRTSRPGIRPVRDAA